MSKTIGINSQMKILGSVLLVLAMVFISCAPKKVTDEQKADCRPSNLRVEAANEQLTVMWDMECESLYGGFNIYISDEPLAEKYPNGIPESIEPHNTSLFKGDTDPFDKVEHYEAKYLKNGQIYYVSACVVFPDMTTSVMTNEVKAVCGPRGEIELSLRYKSDRDGYSFEKDNFVRADNIDNDLYFFSKDGKDYLNSPVRLDGFLKKNLLAKLPFKGSFEEVKAKVLSANISPDLDKLEIKKGDWVQLVTPDNKFALINVIDISGTGNKRVVKLYFAYTTVENELIF